MAKRRKKRQSCNQIKPLTHTGKFVRIIKRLCVVIATCCLIAAAVDAFWSSFEPDTLFLKICAALAAICIFVFLALEAEDKCKSWGLID